MLAGQGWQTAQDHAKTRVERLTWHCRIRGRAGPRGVSSQAVPGSTGPGGVRWRANEIGESW